MEYGNMTAKELYDSKREDLLKLNRVLDLLLRKGFDITDKEIEENGKKLSDIIADINNIIPVIWEDRYGSFANVAKVRTVAISELKSMLAAA